MGIFFSKLKNNIETPSTLCQASPSFFFFLNVGQFWKFLLNLLQYCFCFLVCCCFFNPNACGMLSPRPATKLAAPALESELLTTGPPGEFPGFLLGGADSDSWCGSYRQAQEQTETLPPVGSSNWGWLGWADQCSMGYESWTEMGPRISICFSSFLASLFFFLLLINSFIVLKKKKWTCSF